MNISVNIPNHIAIGITEKIQALRTLKLTNLELKAAEYPLEKLSAADALGLRNLLYDEGCNICLYESDFNLADRETAINLLRNAHSLGVDKILLHLEDCSHEHITFFLDAALTLGITTLVENQAHTSLADGPSIATLLQKYKPYLLDWAFNPFEFVKTRAHPFFHVYYNSRSKNRIGLLRINDGLYIDGSPALPGQGNGEIKELVSIMLARSYRGLFSVSPYTAENNFLSLEKVVGWLRKTLKSL